MDIKMSDVRLPIEKFTEGRFFQQTQTESDKVAKRAFELYDKDLSQDITAREVRVLLKEIYAPIDSKHTFVDSDLKGFIDVIAGGQFKAIQKEHFNKKFQEYYVNTAKSGAEDFQVLNPEIFSFQTKSENKNTSIASIREKLIEIGTKRFGKEFMDAQIELCHSLFESCDFDQNAKLSFDDIHTLFNKLFAYSGLGGSEKSMEVKETQRILEFINYDGDQAICFAEFEIFYLKCFLGS